MDAVIRYCFNIEPEMIESQEKYSRLYSQSKYMLDYVNCAITNKAIATL